MIDKKGKFSDVDPTVALGKTSELGELARMFGMYTPDDQRRMDRYSVMMKKMDTYMATFGDMNQTFTDLFTSMQEISGKLDTVIKGLNLDTVAPAGSKPEPSKIAMANIDVEKEVEKYQPVIKAIHNQSMAIQPEQTSSNENQAPDEESSNETLKNLLTAILNRLK